MHAGENAGALLLQTVEAMLLLFKAMLAKGRSKMVSLSIAFIFENRVCRISSFGWLENQVSWLEKSFPINISEPGLTQWVQAQREYLMLFNINTDSHLMESLLQHDGVLYIKRVPVQVPYAPHFDDPGLRCEINLQNANEAYVLMHQKKLSISLHIAVQKALWSDTKEDYRTSKRSKWLDDHSADVELTECNPLSLYWTPVL